MPSLLPSPKGLAGLSPQDLLGFGTVVAELRQQQLGHLVQPPPPGDAPVIVGPDPPGGRMADSGVGAARHLLNQAIVANKGFDINTGASPIGTLNLERLEMTPNGIERGELIATIPLAPLEETAVEQKEWSVTTKEFKSIVTDSLETYSETGVTDNTELAQATTSQIQHSNQFNITGTVSGGIPLISGSSSATFGAQDAGSQSATDSRKHAASLTQTASSRAKQEHKVTISTTTVSGTSETTTRTLQNPSPTDPIRIDYFSMMRDWRVRLYRYGLRLTYDVVIPEPAGALRRAYTDLATLQGKLGPFVFDVPLSEITTDVLPHETQPHYLVLADRYNTQVPLPPVGVHGSSPVTPNDPLIVNANPPVGLDPHPFQLAIPVPQGYRITHMTLTAFVAGPTHVGYGFGVLGTTFFYQSGQNDQPWGPIPLVASDGGAPFLEGTVGPQNVDFFFWDAKSAMIQLEVHTEPTPEFNQQWQFDVWNALYSAAQTQYYETQQEVAAEVAQLQDRLNNVDTLTLRREESDEIMKAVLFWILGPGFDFMPQDVVDSLGSAWPDFAIVEQYEDLVRFVNEAIEWENVVTFLYSYFWDIPTNWAFIRDIKHPDANRQAFLRAGSARVLLTVRKGWEDAWIRFAEGGWEGAPIPDDHPYLTVAQEIAAYDDRNYPGIPPANPGRTAVQLEDAVYTTSQVDIGPNPAAPGAPVVIKVESSAGFLVGRDAVIDVYDDRKIQEAQMVIEIPDATHITVEGLAKAHMGAMAPFPIIQPGEKGVLIAEWNEYTPTSGTDIAVTSSLATIA